MNADIETLTGSRAAEIIHQFLRRTSGLPFHELDVSGASEYDFGWVFGYQTKSYAAASSAPELYLENGPVIIERSQGDLYAFAPTQNPDNIVNAFQQDWQSGNLERQRSKASVFEPST